MVYFRENLRRTTRQPAVSFCRHTFKREKVETLEKTNVCSECWGGGMLPSFWKETKRENVKWGQRRTNFARRQTRPLQGGWWLSSKVQNRSRVVEPWAKGYDDFCVSMRSTDRGKGVGRLFWLEMRIQRGTEKLFPSYLFRSCSFGSGPPKSSCGRKPVGACFREVSISLRSVYPTPTAHVGACLPLDCGLFVIRGN